MKTARGLLALFHVRQQCLCLGTPCGPPLLPQESRHHFYGIPEQGLHLIQLRLLRIFPSPFSRRSQGPDPFDSATRPPAHIPLPPPMPCEQEPRQLQLAAACDSDISRDWERIREQCTGGVGSTAGLAKVIKTHVAAQRWMQHRIWGCLTRKQWPLFERLLSNYW